MQYFVAGFVVAVLAVVLAVGWYFRKKNSRVGSNKNDYIADYKNLKEILAEKYGSPLFDREVWKNELYRDDYQDWGLAISVGHLVYATQWETDKTYISILLQGDNFKINLGIYYESKQLKPLREEVEQKKAFDEF